MKKVLFGAGVYGLRAKEIFGGENILYYVDNDVKKDNTNIEGVSVYYFDNKIDEVRELILSDKAELVISVKKNNVEKIVDKIESHGIKKFELLEDIIYKQNREKILNQKIGINTYEKAISWIKANTVDTGGIINSSSLKKGYPEVTGYYIPTLLRWGYRDLAYDYCTWLRKIQKDDGAFFDTHDKDPYVFDSAQILKGFNAIYELVPEVKDNIRKASDWILSNMQEDGRLTTPVKDAWVSDKMCSELIHIYCLSPLVEASKILGDNKYQIAARKILKYYLDNFKDKILKFHLLSHFYAYVIEGLIDMGEIELAKQAMKNVEKYQKDDGSIPGYSNVDWVCSTGLFQFAICWYRIGDIEHGNRAFNYACGLQNETGGWFGSYLHSDNGEEANDYFPLGEISWANKFFLDALYYKNKVEFEQFTDAFLENIKSDDGRYQLIRQEIVDYKQLNGDCIRVLDAGCGKGRYLKNLLKDVNDVDYYGMDISKTVLEYVNKISEGIKTKIGTITNIPYDDKSFDIVYACESLEHAVDIESSIKEIVRVIKPGGIIILIDKNIKHLGCMEIGEWEQWFDKIVLCNILKKYCLDVKVIDSIEYEGNWIPGLFCGWVGKKTFNQ